MTTERVEDNRYFIADPLDWFVLFIISSDKGCKRNLVCGSGTKCRSRPWEISALHIRWASTTFSLEQHRHISLPNLKFLHANQWFSACTVFVRQSYFTKKNFLLGFFAYVASSQRGKRSKGTWHTGRRRHRQRHL